MATLIDRGVIGAGRAPDILRLGFTPLYLSGEGVVRAAGVLATIMRDAAWRDPRFQQRQAVT